MKATYRALIESLPYQEGGGQSSSESVITQLKVRNGYHQGSNVGAQPCLDMMPLGGAECEFPIRFTA